MVEGRGGGGTSTTSLPQQDPTYPHPSWTRATVVAFNRTGRRRRRGHGVSRQGWTRGERPTGRGPRMRGIRRLLRLFDRVSDSPDWADVSVEARAATRILSRRALESRCESSGSQIVAVIDYFPSHLSLSATRRVLCYFCSLEIWSLGSRCRRTSCQIHSISLERPLIHHFCATLAIMHSQSLFRSKWTLRRTAFSRNHL